MRTSYVSIRVVVLPLLAILFSSCNSISNVPEERPLQETENALPVMSTDLAIQKLTPKAVQVTMTQQAHTASPSPTQLPTETVEPSLIPSVTTSLSSAAPVLGIQKSADVFYCYDSPFEVTITVDVSDINRDLKLHYYIQDKGSGVRSDEQVIDLDHETITSRSATIIGGGSDDQNLQFPPLMRESYFVYYIVSDDGKYQSPKYTDITFFPCSQ